MAAKRRIPANELANDIRMGMSNAEVMKKYRLSQVGLASVFRKLVQAGVMEKSELQRRMEPGDDTADLDQMRNLARCYPVVTLPVIDLTDLRREGYVRDLTEKGLQVAGIHAKVDETKSLLIQADALSNVLPFTLEARCKWVKEGNTEDLSVSGFEITSLSETNRELLKKTIELFAFCDQTKRA
jgi:hypothetical protein